MKTFKIYKKRDGQSFENTNYIYASNFEEAKKEFAQIMTNENWEKSNNIVWLTEEDGVKETGWYDLNSSKIISKLDSEDVDYENSEMDLFCSEESIENGFEYFNEDVYTWVLKNNFTVLFTDCEGDEDEDVIEADNEEEALIQASEIYNEENGYSSLRLKN